MVDVERVDRLLARLHEDMRALRALAKQDPRDDLTVLAAVKYHFITVIEGCSRIAHHLIASQQWRVAETNGDAVRVLAREGALTRGTAESVARAVGFRNILVHEYVDVDEEAVVDNLERIDELEAFAAEIARWLGTR